MPCDNFFKIIEFSEKKSDLFCRQFSVDRFQFSAGFMLFVCGYRLK